MSSIKLLPASYWCRIIETNKGGFLMRVVDALEGGYCVKVEGVTVDGVERSFELPPYPFETKQEAREQMHEVSAETLSMKIIFWILFGGIMGRENVVKNTPHYVDVVKETKARHK